eukprot:m.383667 g.383667  ORF g.383667 m.383667 type:complete len:50 (-) comp20982_c2_seq2:187-336(-)
MEHVKAHIKQNLIQYGGWILAFHEVKKECCQCATANTSTDPIYPQTHMT